MFVGSCFAGNIGQRLTDDHFHTLVNPYGVMYNPVSVLHTVRRLAAEHSDFLSVGQEGKVVPVLTMGTNHVYVEKATGDIVDNCRKRPQQLFQERCLTVDECASAINESVAVLRQTAPELHVILTVSPIRYRKYGYHGSQLSKATLLLAADEVVKACDDVVYFPAYEVVLDELRDYRFYADDMLHPSSLAVSVLYEKFQDTFFSPQAFKMTEEWRPIREAIAHRPFHPESDEYRRFAAATRERQQAFERKWSC